MTLQKLTGEQKKYYSEINDVSVKFLRKRYNKINRWGG